MSDKEIKIPEGVSMPEIKATSEQQFVNMMRSGNLPPEAKGKNEFTFHRETGKRMMTMRELYQNRKHLFLVWAKDYDTAIELFKKRTKWYKRKGRDVPCPLPEKEE